MITLQDAGHYRIIMTPTGTKVLELRGAAYAWIKAKGIGDILVLSSGPYKVQTVLSVGMFRVYAVKNEPDVVDLPHLELDVGHGRWQGYLLLTGLPTTARKRTRIIPTEAHITDNKHYIVKVGKPLQRSIHQLRDINKKKGGVLTRQ